MAETSDHPTTPDVSLHRGGAVPAEKPFQRSYTFSMKCNSVLVSAWPFGDQLLLLGGAQQPAEPSCLGLGQAEGRGQYPGFIVGFPLAPFCPIAYMFAAS